MDDLPNLHGNKKISNNTKDLLAINTALKMDSQMTSFHMTFKILHVLTSKMKKVVSII